MKGGYLVKYTQKDGSVQKGRAMHADQRPEIEKVKKMLVRLCDDNFKDQLNGEGKKVISLVSTEKLQMMGFID